MKKYIVWYYNKNTKEFTDGGMQYDDMNTAEDFAETNANSRGTSFIIEEIEVEE